MIKKSILSFQILIISLLFVFSNCDNSIVFIDSYRFENWKKKDTFVFKPTGIDTIGEYDLFFMLRNDDKYPYQNLFLISEIEYKDGFTISDTLEYEMATKRGQWLGKGIGLIKENLLWYKENFRFRSKDSLVIKVIHGMRDRNQIEGLDTLKGITDFELRISHSSEKE